MSDSLERRAWALRDLGFEVDVAFGGTGFFWRHDGRFGSWTPRSATENTEAAVRAAVLRVAPGSWVRPAHRVPRWVCAIVRDEAQEPYVVNGVAVQAEVAKSGSYAEAWINAAEAIVAAGLHRHDPRDPERA